MAAGQVNVKLVSDGGTWYDCGGSTGETHDLSCTVSVAAADADSLTVARGSSQSVEWGGA
jgi:hypothetical protein